MTGKNMKKKISENLIHDGSEKGAVTEMTYGGLLREAEQYLEWCGIEENRTDAWYLFSDCFSMDRASYFLRAASAVPEEETEAAVRFRNLLEQRGSRIPLQQILGVQEFMGLEFAVNGDVLIPRQDTEVLVEEILKDLIPERKQDGAGDLAVLDLCTGSGCIGISLARYLAAYFTEGAGPSLQVVLSDISEKALRVAGENIRRLQCASWCSTVRSDLFEVFGQAGRLPARFDVIVSNPPYIPSGVIGTLAPEVKDHEPRLALDGEADGLAFYRRIAAQAPDHLNPGGRLYVEIGWDQGEPVKKLFEAAQFAEVAVIRDLAGNDRVITSRNLNE